MPVMSSFRQNRIELSVGLQYTFRMTHSPRRLLDSVVREAGTLAVDDIRRLVGKEDPVILEIGANVGQTTAEFIKAIPKARIYCFEPDPRAAAKFRRAISPAHTNVKLFECAVGDANGSVVFHQSSGEGDRKEWDQSGSIRKPKSHIQVWPWVKFQDQIEVPIVRLDDWANEQGITEVDFIWADVQGAEIDLIMGAKQTLQKTRFLYTEYSNDEWYEGQITLGQLYESLDGFSVCRVFPMDALFENSALKKEQEFTGMRLHLGGKEVKTGWKILNISQDPGVDFLGNISDLSQFGDESCEEVYASHVLEHVPQQRVLDTLKGICRILKPGSRLCVSVPDLDILCHTFINPLASPAVKFHVMRMMFGGQVDQHDCHYFGWNQLFLFDFLRQAGFSKVERTESFGLFKDTSDYKPYGFPISLNAIATK